MRKKLGEICPYDPLERTWAELIVEATLKMAVGGDITALHQVCAQLGAAEMKRIEKILLKTGEGMSNDSSKLVEPAGRCPRKGRGSD